ncbi:MAG TPA: FecR domain-containing protein [Polyangia bacterium]
MKRNRGDEPFGAPGADVPNTEESAVGESPLDAQTRQQIFAVWQGPSEPAPGAVAARVAATLASTSVAPAASRVRDTVAGPKRTRMRWAVLALVLPAVAAVAVWGGRRLREASGETVAAARATVTLGGRGKAVLEAGARVRWSVSAGNHAEIHQAAGDVFYRVEKGGPFSVHTPAGIVRAVGTCFRVEVLMNGKRQTALAGATGAALAAAVVVSVYEGKVLLAGGTTSQAVQAGEQAVMEGGDVRRGGRLPAPRLQVRAEGDAPDPAAALPLPPPEELPARYRAQSEELARLRAQVAALQAGPGGGGPRSRGGDNFVDPSREELLARAQSCTLAWDSPPLDMEAIKVDDRWGLTPEEKAIVTPILAKFKEDQLRAIRELYVEVTGAKALAEQLSPRALTSEIKEKAPPGEVQRAYQQISGELAGTIAPPGPRHQPSAVERLARLQSTAGERFERAIAAELGATRAREVRKKNNGWNSRSNESVGCPRDTSP